LASITPDIESNPGKENAGMKNAFAVADERLVLDW
jgi:hypothetical protein